MPSHDEIGDSCKKFSGRSKSSRKSETSVVKSGKNILMKNSERGNESFGRPPSGKEHIHSNSH